MADDVSVSESVCEWIRDSIEINIYLVVDV
jgi:hypothetical protein